MKIASLTYKPYFTGGLKKNLREGEDTLKDYRKEFPYLNQVLCGGKEQEMFKRHSV